MHKEELKIKGGPEAKQESQPKDLPFLDYTRRQYREVSADRIRERAQEIHPSGNFRFNGRAWEPQEYQGFAIASMVADNPHNDLLPFELEGLQIELISNLYPADAYYKLPAASFHQTVANTLSAERFQHSIVDRGLEPAYPEIVREVFTGMEPSPPAGPVRMKLIGLGIFGTSLGMLGIFEDEEDYNRILRFRSQFYGNSRLFELGVLLTRPFIGHITLLYVEKLLDRVQRAHLAETVIGINEQLVRKNVHFLLSHTELRRYHHLAEFKRPDYYPIHLL
ncbi:MAG: hypothetical protein P4L51_22000 [Puia sp.]|nr:hypothetical protein [Puia sp.]